MKGMEIERKFLLKNLPADLSSYPHKELEQGYLSTDPVVRVRKEGEDYILTYKSSGLLSRREENLPLTEESYTHLIAKADGYVITKTRYYIPYGTHTIELDIFHGDLSALQLAEVEFDSEDAAKAFTPPDWFGEDVTYETTYHNSTLSQHGLTAQS